MSADAKDRFEAAMERLRCQLDVAFNPVIGGPRVIFTVMFAEADRIDAGGRFMTSHISNADNFDDQIAMAKAFIAKCELFQAEVQGGVQ